MLKTPSQNRALITVQNLLQSSVIILNQDLPLSKFTTRMLSAKSGYSVGSIYQYFTNKEEIFYALIQQDIDELKNKVNKIYLSNSFLNHKEVVKFLIGDCIDLIDKNRIVRVKLINWLLSQPKKNDMAKTFMSLLDQFINHLHDEYSDEFEPLTQTQRELCKHSFLNLFTVLLYNDESAITRESFRICLLDIIGTHFKKKTIDMGLLAETN